MTNKYLLDKYGWTLIEYNKLGKLQKWLCAICEKRYRLNVDHLHVVKDKKSHGACKRYKVRGLLCFQCNKYLVGKHKDSRLLRKAADYLDNPPARAVIKY